MVFGWATLNNGKKLRIAGLTEQETNDLTEMSRGADLKRPGSKGKIKAGELRRRVIAFSLNKGGHPDWEPKNWHLMGVQHHQLKSKLTGELTSIQKQIMDLSGMELPEQDAQEVFD